MVFRFRARPYVYLLPKQLDEQVVKLHFRALWEHKFLVLVRAQVNSFWIYQQCLSEPEAPMPFMQQGIWIIHSVSSSSVYQLS